MLRSRLANWNLAHLAASADIRVAACFKSTISGRGCLVCKSGCVGAVAWWALRSLLPGPSQDRILGRVAGRGACARSCRSVGGSLLRLVWHLEPRGRAGRLVRRVLLLLFCFSCMEGVVVPHQAQGPRAHSRARQPRPVPRPPLPPRPSGGCGS